MVDSIQSQILLEEPASVESHRCKIGKGLDDAHIICGKRVWRCAVNIQVTKTPVIRDDSNANSRSKWILKLHLICQRRLETAIADGNRRARPEQTTDGPGRHRAAKCLGEGV